MKQYEAMFLFDPTFGASFEACEGEIGRLMERADAEILLCRKWDERRLAYRIDGRKRGVYALVYFKAPPEKIAPLERDAKLSENVLRLLVLRADEVDREAMERAFVRREDEGSRPGDSYGRERPPRRDTEAKPKAKGSDGSSAPAASTDEKAKPAGTEPAGAEPAKAEPVGDPATTAE